MNKKPMMRIYVAGRFRSEYPEVVELNKAAAEHAGMLIAKRGHFPVVPHLMTGRFNAVRSEKFWLEATKREMLTCDGVFFIQGWRGSQGAREEYEEAVNFGLKVYTDIDDIEGTI